MNETIMQSIRKSNRKYFMVKTFRDGEEETVTIKSFDKLSTAIFWVINSVTIYQTTSIRFCGDVMIEMFQRHLDGTFHRVCYKSMKRQVADWIWINKD